MKVAFVVKGIRENIGVEYLSAVLKQRGHSVALVLDPSLFEDLYFYNKFLARCLNYDDVIVEEIANIKPHLIAFSVLSDDFAWALRIARNLKRTISVPIIFGGLHSSSVPELVIKKDVVDYVCIGEGEEVLTELLDYIEKDKDTSCINNIWFKRNGTIIKTPFRRLKENLDELPFPDKDIFYNQHPLFLKQAYKTITSRGCPNSCSYCYNSYLRNLYRDKGRYLRRRSVDNVISELILAKERYKINRITFLDDTFIYDLKWLRSFISKYKDYIGLPFSCTLYPAFVNKEVVRLLKEGGCITVNMGIQDINEKLRRSALNRKDTNLDIERAIRLVKKSNIFMYTTIILGLPTQKEEDINDTVHFLNKFRPNIPDSNWMRYYPKTAIVDFALKHNLLTQKEIDRINESQEFRPYAFRGHGFSFKALRYRNLLFLTCILPKNLISKILRGRLYYLIPPVDMRVCILMIVFIFNRLSRKRKQVYPIFSFNDIFNYYFYFIRKRIFLWINRLFNFGS